MSRSICIYILNVYTQVLEKKNKQEQRPVHGAGAWVTRVRGKVCVGEHAGETVYTLLAMAETCTNTVVPTAASLSPSKFTNIGQHSQTWPTVRQAERDSYPHLPPIFTHTHAQTNLLILVHRNMGKGWGVWEFFPSTPHPTSLQSTFLLAGTEKKKLPVSKVRPQTLGISWKIHILIPCHLYHQTKYLDKHLISRYHLLSQPDAICLKALLLILPTNWCQQHID